MHTCWRISAVVIFFAVISAATGGRELSTGGAARDETARVTLWGNTPPEALHAANDRGRIPDSFRLDHMILTLRRSPARAAALERYLAQLTDRNSHNYHRWLTPGDIGRDYGPSRGMIARVSRWLEGYGFSIGRIYPSGMAIDFSGTAGQVREAFRTDIHRIEIRGQDHIANVSDPSVPAALAPAVAGIASLNDFHGHQASHGGPGWTVTNCGLGSNDLIANCYFVAPPDLATIYHFAPLFGSGEIGTGQTIAVAEDSDMYSTNDWTLFRTLFGLSGYAGASVSQTHPGGCGDPGANGDDFEATLDAEYASAAAPGAAIDVASCADSKTTWGLVLAIENLVNSASPPSILSVSYIWCEADAGLANNQLFNDMYQQAAAEGVSVFVASGDEGAATCDYGQAEASHGIAANGLASTPYDVAVGGTDFEDTYFGENAQYWTNTNGSDYKSVKSYVPEIPWDGSCGSKLIAKYVTGSTLTYGTTGFCNVAQGQNFITTYAGSGAPSTCALAKTGGGCKGYPKPSWQNVYGVPGSNVRELPDVSLFSAAPVWGHAYVVCYSDPARDFGEPCKNFPKGWIYGYGTSFAAPVMAGVQALVNQATASLQGNPDPVLYQIANREFGSGGNPVCNSSLGTKVGVKCTFHDVTQGGMDIPCVPGSTNCYAPSGNIGVLSLSPSRYEETYRAHSGWDSATGLGTVNAANLVAAWPR